MNKKKLIQALFTIATLSATAAINYSLFHTPFIFVVLTVLLAHELGHYFIARMHNGDPDLPYFIPFPIVAIGVTRIKRMKFLSFNSKKKISLYGPLVGLISSIILFLLSLILFPIYSIPLLMLCFTEVLFNYFGVDGKKYRSYSRQEFSVCF